MKPLGLQQKFGVALASAGIMLLLVLGVLWLTGSRSQLEVIEGGSELMREQAWSDLEQRGQVTVRFLAETLPNLIYYYDLKGLRDAARSALEQDDIEYVLIYDLDGRILHDGTATLARFGEVMADPLAEAVMESDQALTQWRERIIDISHPVRLGAEPIGGVRIGLSRVNVEAAISERQAAMTMRVQDTFLEQTRILLLTGLLLLLAAAVFGWLVGRGLVRPIRALAGAARQMEAGHYDRIRLDTARHDELGELMRAFGDMAGSFQKHDQTIRELAYQDTLTGLPNRLMARELLDQAMQACDQHGRRLGLMFIDLDDFKRVNDSFGHDIGDEVLAEIAGRLERCAATDEDPAGVRFARLGGDEFVALVTGQNIDHRCQALAECVIEQLQQPFSVGQKTASVSASIGITRYPDDASSGRGLLKTADQAMYQAKLKGKNRWAIYAGD